LLHYCVLTPGSYRPALRAIERALGLKCALDVKPYRLIAQKIAVQVDNHPAIASFGTSCYCPHDAPESGK
jgi:hypothetical protein